MRIKNFSLLIGRANGVLDANGDSVKSQKQEIGLFLDGRLISDLAPELGAPLKDTSTKEDIGTVRFHLQRNAHNDEAWADILGSPKNDFFIYRNIPVSVGLVNEYAEELHAVFNLIRIRQGWFWVCLFAMLAYLFGLINLASKSNVIRDHWIDASAIGIIRAPQLNPFSLARVQMAFWFSLVIASYFFIWLITGATDILTTSTLALIGISAVTALSAVVIDNNKGQDLVNQTSVLKDEENKLIVEIAGITPSVIAANPTMQAILNQKVARLTDVQSAIKKNTDVLTKNLSSGFLTDILTDENGVSFHRLQMAVWTIILGLLFIHSVYTRLSMPEFSSTLLALQGMTAGTYLGFKIPEKHG